MGLYAPLACRARPGSEKAIHGPGARPMHLVADHLLRTFAAVPVGSRVLYAGSEDAGLAEPLALLGFDLYAEAIDEDAAAVPLPDALTPGHTSATDHPDDFFDWIVLYAAGVTGARLIARLGDLRRVLKPGGWLYLVLEARSLQGPGERERGRQEGTVDRTATLTQFMQARAFAEAERPGLINEGGVSLAWGIYRRVEAGTPP